VNENNEECQVIVLSYFYGGEECDTFTSIMSCSAAAAFLLAYETDILQI
jgi:hypothetical protein